MGIITTLKERITCLEAAQRYAPEQPRCVGNKVWRFKYKGCKDGSSTWLSEQKDRWHCYAKDVGGDAISLVEFLLFGTTRENVSGAIDQLCADLNIPRQQDDFVADRRDYDAQAVFRDVVRYAETFADRALPMLEQRGISAGTAKRCRVGYIPSEGIATWQESLGKRFNLSACGLLTEDGRFLLRDRVIFPIIRDRKIMNLRGYSPTSQIKYLSLRASQYTKLVPFGCDLIDDPKLKGAVWITEGIFDALSVIEAGMPAIAVLSANVTDSMFLDIMDEVGDRPVRVALDYDAGSHTGQDGTYKMLNLFLRKGISVSAVELKPAMFDTELSQGTDNAVLRLNMSVEELGRVFGLDAKRTTETVLGSLNIEIENGFVDGYAAAQQLIKAGRQPLFTVAIDGMLKEFTQQAKRYYPDWPPTKIDLNDVWQIVERSPEAMMRVGARATDGLAYYLKHSIDTSGMTEKEIVDSLVNILCNFRELAPDEIKRAIGSMGLPETVRKSVSESLRVKTNPVVSLANLFMTMFGVKTMPDYGLCLYDKDLGIWVSLQRQYMNHLLYKHLLPDSTPVHNVSEPIFDQICAACYQNRTSDTPEPPPRYVVLTNGVYDLRDGRFIYEFSPNYFAMTRLNVTYIEGAECPKFKKFLWNILVRPCDEEEMGDGEVEMFYHKIECIREALGLYLVPDSSFQKIWLWIGGGRNGKGQLATIMTHLLGARNVSTVRLGDFDEKFFMPLLVGKILNFGSEEDRESITPRAMGLLKSISGQDLIAIQEKNEKAFMMRLKTRLVFMMNNMPSLPDRSSATDQRVRDAVFHFPVAFTLSPGEHETGNKRVKVLDVYRTMMDEAPGIFNWLIEGYRNLAKRGYMLKCDDYLDLMVDRFENDPCFRFLEECVGFDQNSTLKRAELQKLYTAWYQERVNRGQLNPRMMLQNSDAFKSVVLRWAETLHPTERMNVDKVRGYGRGGESVIFRGLILRTRKVGDELDEQRF